VTDVAVENVNAPVEQEGQARSGNIREEKRLYRDLFDSVGEGIFQTDLEGRYLIVNPAFASILGCEMDELLEDNISTWQSHLPEDVIQEFQREILERGELRKKVINFARPDGSEVWAELTFSVRRSDDGSPLGYEGVVREISERVRYESRLEALHQHASELVNAASIEEIAELTFKTIEWVLGFHGGDFNIKEGDELRAIYSKGVDLKEHVDLPLDGPGVIVRAYATKKSQLIHDTREDDDYIEVVLDDGGRSLSELAVPVVVDGEVEAVINLESERLNAFTPQDQRLLEIFAEHVASAMGRLREMERLKKSEEKFRQLLEESMDAVAVLVGTNIVYANKRLAELHGFIVPQEIIGRDCLELIAEKDRELVRTRALGRQRGEEQSLRYEFTLLKIDGTPVDIEANVSFIEYEGKPASLAFIRNITDRKKMEKELRDYADRLEERVKERTAMLREAERMAAIGELAAMVGHDLRNPLTGIMGAAYYLRKKYGSSGDDETLKMLEIIEHDIKYSDKIISDLLDYSKNINLDPSKTDPRALVREALDQVKIPENVAVFDLTSDGPAIEVDDQMIKRVFVNLITNACDAMPTGGELIIESQRTQEAVEISFTDTGKGIPEEIIADIWRPLFTTKAKGMGFGLSICKRILESHGGSISVVSRPEEGTTFTVRLPHTWRGVETTAS